MTMANRNIAVIFLSCLALAGCSTTLAFQSVPSALASQALVKGFAKIRAWGDSDQKTILETLDIKYADQPTVMAGAVPAPSHLALSGGGGDGAFGAGLLVGWSAAGNRPRFSIVTGVSTGALTAPFAFLGSRHDSTLNELYTRYRTSDLGTPNILAALNGAASLADSAGLETLIAKYVDDTLMAEVAREHRAGRRLLVATTNVEAQRQVIWSLGAIAASGRRDALMLMRNVIRASAAIPGIFPPVTITVVADGMTYQELHGDGGTTGQVFFVPLPSSGAVAANNVPKETLYVVRNGKLAPQWNKISPTVVNLAGRALETIIRSQSRGDLERLRARARAAQVQFKLAAIPETFSHDATEPFDIDYMKALFAVGFDQGRRGNPWATRLP